MQQIKPNLYRIENDGSKVLITAPITQSLILDTARRSLESMRNNRELIYTLKEHEIVWLKNIEDYLELDLIPKETYADHLFNLLLNEAEESGNGLPALLNKVITKENLPGILKAHSSLDNLLNYLSEISTIIKSDLLKDKPEHLSVLLQDKQFIQAYKSYKYLLPINALSLAIDAYLNRVNLDELQIQYQDELNFILLFSALGGHTDTLKALSKKGITGVSHRNHMQVTPLHFACLGGHVETVKFLLESTQDLNEKTVQHHNALFFAAQGGHKSILELLLLEGISKAPSLFGETALHLAAHQEDVGILLFLIESGYSPYQQTARQETILHIACRNGSIKILDFCLTGILDIPRLCGNTHNPIKAAIAANQNSLIEILIKSNPELLTDDLLRFTKLEGSRKTIRQLETYYYCPWVLSAQEVSIEKAPLLTSITNPLKDLLFGVKKVTATHLNNLACEVISKLTEKADISLEELENALHQISRFYKKQFHRKPGAYALLLHTLFTEISLASKNYVKAREDLPHQEALELILQKETEELCPISIEIPRNRTRILQPSRLLGRQSYERGAIKAWIQEYAETDPITRAPASLESMIAFSAKPQKVIEEILKIKEEKMARKRKAEEIS